MTAARCRTYETHQMSLAVVLVRGCPALGPVAAHGREAAVGDQAPQHDVSADVGALLKGRRRFSLECVGSYDANRHTTLLHAI